MSESCTHNCSTCSSKCSSAESKKSDSFIEQPHSQSNIKKVIGIVSGKGGVGKSMVTSLMAVNMQRKGYNAAILDADITGPSIPTVFGISEKVKVIDEGMFPAETKTGIKIMSTNLLLKEKTDPVIWRGPVIAGMAKQFWTDVIWSDVDYMFVDMPPGTGDVPQTVFQSIRVDGIIIVTSPQQLVSMIVEKAVKMAGMMNVPILGIVENMSYFECPDCGGKHNIYGESRVDETASKYKIPCTAKIPISPKLAAGCDAGMIELFEGDWLDEMASAIE